MHATRCRAERSRREMGRRARISGWFALVRMRPPPTTPTPRGVSSQELLVPTVTAAFRCCLVLVDTSVWIEIFRKGSRLRLEAVADSDEVVTCLPVIQEVLQGFDDE